MSSPPLSEPGDRAGLFSSGRFVHERARVGPRPWSRIRKQFLARDFVLATWPSCRGTRKLAASELAVVPIHHALLTEPERLAGPSAPHSATPDHAFHLTPRRWLRAERRSATRRAQSPHRHAAGGSVQTIENGSNFEIGPTVIPATVRLTGTASQRSANYSKPGHCADDGTRRRHPSKGRRSHRAVRLVM